METIKLLIDLYDAWRRAVPGAGYDAQAAEWRARLPTKVESKNEATSKR